MTYTEEHKTIMKAIAKLTAFQEFSHECMNDIVAAITNILLIERAETNTQEQELRTLALEALNKAMREFREVGA